MRTITLNDKRKPIRIGVFDELQPCQCNNKEAMKKRRIIFREGNTAYPVENVNIVNLSQRGKGTITDKQGNYVLEASAGDNIRFSHVAMQSVTLLYRDIPDILEMKSGIELDEVVVTPEKNQKTPSLNQKIKKYSGWALASAFFLGFLFLVSNEDNDKK
ncbi:hypothetical protein ACILE2_10945 [Capnocytophaga canimorsus]|uniref:hypothetical protein n=1 Tax=Capnocytophaga canimorsus TaxID=28188 RepID=UPI0037D29FAB